MGDWRIHELPDMFGHHSEPGDPILFEWIKNHIDGFVGLSSTAVVIILGVVMLIIPIVILLIYMAFGYDRDRL